MRIERPDETHEAQTWSKRFEHLQREKEDRSLQEIFKNGQEYTVDTAGLGHFPVCFLSDVHLGHVGTDYKAVDRYINAIQDNNIYVVLLGDLGDFFNPKILAHAMGGDMEDVDQQMETIKTFLTELNGDKDDRRILGMVSGNHEAFAKNSASITPYRWIARDMGIPLLEAGSILKLNVDKEQYNIGLWHKFKRFNSALNLTHAGKQNKRMLGVPMDLVVSGDKHIGACEQYTDGDQITTVLQLGSFKEEDEWGREEGMLPNPRAFFPVCFFNGHEKDILPVRNLDTAVSFMETFREGLRLKGVALLGHAGLKEHPPSTP